MRISAKVDYAVRAAVELAAGGDQPVKGEAVPLQKVWIALRANLRAVMDDTSLADVVSGELPAAVRELSEPAEAWSQR